MKGFDDSTVSDPDGILIYGAQAVRKQESGYLQRLYWYVF
jgi:hypothetical protein